MRLFAIVSFLVAPSALLLAGTGEGPEPTADHEANRGGPAAAPLLLALDTRDLSQTLLADGRRSVTENPLVWISVENSTDAPRSVTRTLVDEAIFSIKSSERSDSVPLSMQAENAASALPTNFSFPTPTSCGIIGAVALLGLMVLRRLRLGT